MKPVLLVGGGTLGSVNPLLAVAAALREKFPHTSLVFWGSRQPRDRVVVQATGLTFESIPAGKFRRYFSLHTISDAGIVVWAFFVALRRLRKLRPALIMTAGSYVAVPVAWAARCLRIPVVLYQQDATLGLANRLIMRVATVRVGTTEYAARLLTPPAAVVGFALRPDLFHGNADRAARTYHLDATQPVILVIGGSSGALTLNQTFAAALLHLQARIQVIHITGSGKEVTVTRPGYVQIPFTNEALPDLYAIATLVVSRAGSNVLAELVALRKPMLIVPLPNTHQVQNAVVLEERGVLVRDQRTLTGAALAADLNALCDAPERLASLREAVADFWETDGAQSLVQRITTYL